MADQYLNCGDCEKRMSVAMRASWRCGWLPPDERTGPGFRGAPPQWEHSPDDLCPGYLITIPQVTEAARAHYWMEKGQLGELYTEQSPLLHESINALAGASNAAESDLYRRMGEK